MPHVITEKCLGERYAACVEVCPVDCIHPGDYNGEAFMVIDPLTCIDCGLCLPECPVAAIVPNIEESPEYTKINEELAPQYQNNPKVEVRPATDPPKKPGNKNIKLDQ